MAQNVSGFGQQYLQNQQQQQLFDRLAQNRNVGYYGFNPYSNTNTFAMQSQAGQLGTS
jgi:O-methyltransferase involved in polyketide biosynthesis